MTKDYGSPALWLELFKWESWFLFSCASCCQLQISQFTYNLNIWRNLSKKLTLPQTSWDLNSTCRCAVFTMSTCSNFPYMGIRHRWSNKSCFFLVSPKKTPGFFAPFCAQLKIFRLLWCNNGLSERLNVTEIWNLIYMKLISKSHAD